MENNLAPSFDFNAVKKQKVKNRKIEEELIKRLCAREAKVVLEKHSASSNIYR